MSPFELKIAGDRTWYALGWALSLNTGWGVLGLNLALELGRAPGCGVLLLADPDFAGGQPHPLHRHLLQPALDAQRQFREYVARWPGRVFRLDVPLLQPAAAGLRTIEIPFRGRPHVALAVFEDTHFPADAVARAADYDLVVAGSTWNADVLRRNGVGNVTTVFQGIDTTLYHPAPRGPFLRDRFVVFSGGKLEYRKGQDVVVAAFRAFKARHPEAFLLTLWQNRWAGTLPDLDRAGHVRGRPQVDAAGQMILGPWLAANGIAAEDTWDVGLVVNHQLPLFLRHADVAVFASRAEGATNLVAMECLASGLPAILSANTGHLDLIDDSRCVPLRRQQPARPAAGYAGVDGWGESSVDELVEALEGVYRNRDEARRKGQDAAEFMRGRSSAAFADGLRAALRITASAPPPGPS